MFLRENPYALAWDAITKKKSKIVVNHHNIKMQRKNSKWTSSTNWANYNFNFPATFFIAFIWATNPTLDTEITGLIAGRIPALNRSVDENIFPSIMEIALVGI